MTGRTGQAVSVRASLGLAGLLACASLAPPHASALTPAGTTIQNQASATYAVCLDTVCATRSDPQYVTSNLVETLIQPVPTCSLAQDQTRFGAETQSARFPHVITNTGNVADRYALAGVTTLGGDDFDPASLHFFADADRDGLPDDTTAITTTPQLAPGESYAFVATATVADAAPNLATGSRGQFDIEARSAEEGNAATVECSNRDTIRITDKALLEVTKRISPSSSTAGSGPYTVTLTYHNHGSVAATHVDLWDTLPSGMTYVPGSARWSVTGSGTALTDANPADAQGSGPTLVWCDGYHHVCSGGVSANFSANRLNARISSVPAGASGLLSFSVTIDSGLAAQTLDNTAHVTHDDCTDPLACPQPTNRATLTLEATASVVANDSASDSAAGANDASATGNVVTVASVAEGATASFEAYVWNTGNATDTLDLTLDRARDRHGVALAHAFPAGTTFRLLHGDGATPLTDSNGNGVPDSGSVPVPGGSCPPRFVHDAVNGHCGYKVVVQAVMPAGTNGNNGGAGWDATLIATSGLALATHNAISLHLTAVGGSTVDLRNCDDFGDCTPGSGSGPEASPVLTATATPGTTTLLRLRVVNGGAATDSYALAYSTSLFSAGTLPTGWSLRFERDGGGGHCATTSGAPIIHTGPIAADSAALVCALVTIPPTTATDADGNPAVDADGDGDPANDRFALYFRATSELTGAADTLYDAVRLIRSAGLTLEPDQIGQAEPGGTVVHVHELANRGNVALEQVVLTVAESLAAQGWTSELFVDVDADRQLGAADTRISPGVALSFADGRLDVGERLTLLVKVFVPAGAPLGSANTTTLSVTADPVGPDATVHTDTATDLTTANTGHLMILKHQALDADCDGLPDGPGACTEGDEGCYTLEKFPAEPGRACVIYRLTATNTSAQPAYHVKLSDVSPPFTRFLVVPGVVPRVTQGNVPALVDGATGLVQGGSVGGANITVNPGASLKLYFGIRVE